MVNHQESKENRQKSNDAVFLSAGQLLKIITKKWDFSPNKLGVILDPRNFFKYLT